MSWWVPALVDGIKGRKLVIFRNKQDLEDANKRYPLADVMEQDDLFSFSPEVIVRAFSNFIRGEDGLLYCHKNFEGRDSTFRVAGR